MNFQILFIILELRQGQETQVTKLSELSVPKLFSGSAYHSRLML